MPLKSSQSFDGPLLNIAFLWHQHQPYYKNIITGEYLLPWVRLHAVKDYLDMVEILDRFPSIKQTFNFVPSLLEQLNDYATGEAVDPHLSLSRKNAAELTMDEKSQMLGLLFQAQHGNMIAPIARYSYLHRTRDRALTDWTEAEWRDLQALFNLAWIDPLFKSGGRLKELAAKGERYTEDEKLEILSEQRRIIARIVPSLRAHLESGQIEVSVTPYFHPIMPLLYDTSSALEAMPGAPLPQRRFRHPEDVARQVESAINLYQELFGAKPAGMWPSEGSVSEDIIPIIHKYGIEWMATDEEILAQSLGVPGRTSDSNSLLSSGQLYRGYEFEKETARMTLFFRDHVLSDNIGFVYSSWDPQKAADDFIAKIAEIRRNVAAKKIGNPIVSIILDGENAWEFYRNDGHDFLEALYTAIDKSPWLKAVTFSEYLGINPALGKLKKLFAGSWINHDFAVWIGHQEDNRAWDLLSRVRDELEAFERENPSFVKGKLQLAWKEIMIAEGSDWCWWFGEDHVGPNNNDFDRLFRLHLANVYWLTDREPPLELYEPVRSSYIDAHFLKPVDFITPIIDGRITHFYEWQVAGYFDCSKAGSTMHKSEHLIAGFWCGFDTDNLYFGLRRGVTVNQARFARFAFELEFFDTLRTTVLIVPSANGALINGQSSEEIKMALIDIMEASIPIGMITESPQAPFYMRVSIIEEDKKIETWPPTDALRIDLPNPHEIPWTV